MDIPKGTVQSLTTKVIRRGLAHRRRLLSKAPLFALCRQLQVSRPSRFSLRPAMACPHLSTATVVTAVSEKRAAANVPSSNSLAAAGGLELVPRARLKRSSRRLGSARATMTTAMMHRATRMRRSKRGLRKVASVRADLESLAVCGLLWAIASRYTRVEAVAASVAIATDRPRLSPSPS